MDAYHDMRICKIPTHVLSSNPCKNACIYVLNERIANNISIIIPPATKLGGGILDSACLSVRLSVCLSVNFFVSAL